MMMEVKVVSRENIKPSSPTPHHLRTFLLLMLHSSSFIPMKMVLPISKSIDCNDEGACYMETEVHCCLADFLSQPDLQVMHRFLPRRFAFDASAIANLKAKAASNSVQNPTRVEAVSAFIWKCAMAASEETRGFTRPSLLSHVVNLQRRTIPPLMENSIGNLIWIASAHCKARYDELGLKGLVGQVREGISKINSDFIKKLQGDERSTVICKSLKMMEEPGSKDGGVDYFGFTSWCKLGFYEADFGLGKPIWVSGVGSTGSVFLNLIILMETRSGNGIEAWVTLDEQEMAILQCDMELLTFASLDPNPLKLGNIAAVNSPNYKMAYLFPTQ